MVRLGCTLLFFDTYLKWLRLGGWGPTVEQPKACDEPSLLPAVPLARVTPALLLSVVEQLLFCAVVSTTARALALAPCRWASLATAVLLSSFGKCFAESGSLRELAAVNAGQRLLRAGSHLRTK